MRLLRGDEPVRIRGATVELRRSDQQRLGVVYRGLQDTVGSRRCVMVRIVLRRVSVSVLVRSRVQGRKRVACRLARMLFCFGLGLRLTMLMAAMVAVDVALAERLVSALMLRMAGMVNLRGSNLGPCCRRLPSRRDIFQQMVDAVRRRCG